MYHSVGVKCAPVNLTDIMHRFGGDLVMPQLPDGANTTEFDFNEEMNFTCDIPGRGVEMRTQRCVPDEDNNYRLVGDSLECKSKKIRMNYLA